jgi:hypothetical protein
MRAQHLPKALPLNSITWGGRISSQEFEGDTNIQTMQMGRNSIP